MFLEDNWSVNMFYVDSLMLVTFMCPALLPPIRSWICLMVRDSSLVTNQGVSASWTAKLEGMAGRGRQTVEVCCAVTAPKGPCHPTITSF